MMQAAHRNASPPLDIMAMGFALSDVQRSADRLAHTVNVLLTLAISDVEKEEVTFTRADLTTLFIDLSSKVRTIVEASANRHLQAVIDHTFGKQD